MTGGYFTALGLIAFRALWLICTLYLRVSWFGVYLILCLQERAVMEHNMVASSRIYDNVSFKELGMLLQIPCQQVCAFCVSDGVNV